MRYQVGGAIFSDRQRQIFDRGDCGCPESVAYFGFGEGGHGERAKREPIRGSGAEPPSGVQGQSPCTRGQGGEATLKLKHFAFECPTEAADLHIFFSEFLTRRKSQIFALFCKNEVVVRRYVLIYKLLSSSKRHNMRNRCTV